MEAIHILRDLRADEAAVRNTLLDAGFAEANDSHAGFYLQNEDDYDENNVLTAFYLGKELDIPDLPISKIMCRAYVDLLRTRYIVVERSYGNVSELPEYPKVGMYCEVYRSDLSYPERKHVGAD